MSMTVLMAVYAGDDDRHLQQAFDSLLKQVTPADAMVLVADGPLTAEVERVIQAYIQPLRMHLVRLPNNQGLASALNAGLQHVQTPWVLRFDADDVCCPDRITRQKARVAIGDVDLVGGQIEEFQHEPGDSRRMRRVPCDPTEIHRFARRRNPFNHMTVCFRLDEARRVGGYPLIAGMEDYALWLRLMASGARVCNLPEVLVHARIGNGMVARRGGIRYVRSEVRIQHLMWRLGMKSAMRACFEGVIRSVVFMAPHWLRARVYDTQVMRARAGKG